MTQKIQTAEQVDKGATNSPPLTGWTLFIKATFLSLAFAGGMLLLTAFVIIVWGYFQFQKFLAVLNVPRETFFSEIQSGWNTTPLTQDGRKNFLILGTDVLIDERGDVPPLTDTLILLSLNLNTGDIHTVSLPRDIWSDAYQTKINALYAYGFQRNPDKPENFPTQVIHELTGIPIHHTLVLSLEELRTLIDMVGGVEVAVETGFTDPLFPREGVDVTVVRDPALLYETITFEPGSQIFSGERALQYIRSRQSEGDEGHDLARGVRQQRVIQALFAKLTQYKMFINRPELAGELYNFYHAHFEQALPLSELVRMIQSLAPYRKDLRFQNHHLTALTDDPENGVLENPPPSPLYQNQWIYRIPDLARFRERIQTLLLLYS